ncbi:MAG: hypothetical protein FWE33_02010 [Defluviitaleaceae bacterium]|nr:hypothetical protein [Defluviitaleaceae bacterium]
MDNNSKKKSIKGAILIIGFIIGSAFAISALVLAWTTSGNPDGASFGLPIMLGAIAGLFIIGTPLILFFTNKSS